MNDDKRINDEELDKISGGYRIHGINPTPPPPRYVPRKEPSPAPEGFGPPPIYGGGAHPD